MAAGLRQRGFRTYRSHISANVSCTLNAAALVESHLERIAERRGSRVQIVGHSLGGMIARGIAVRRPDLVSGIVTMGSPMLAPAAHHRLLTGGVSVLNRLSAVGLPGVMSRECVSGLVCRDQLPRGAPAAPGRRGDDQRLLPPRRHRRLEGVHRPRGRRRRGAGLAHRHRRRPARDHGRRRVAAAADVAWSSLSPPPPALPPDGIAAGRLGIHAPTAH